jgi:hypothetical protein
LSDRFDTNMIRRLDRVEYYYNLKPTEPDLIGVLLITRIHITDIAYNLFGGYELRKEALQERASTA